MSLARQQLLAASVTGQSGSPRAGTSAGGPHAPGQHSIGPAPPGMSIQQQLEQLPTEQLEKLLTDQDAFKQFTIKLMSEAQASRALAEIQARNRSLAQENLDLQAGIEEAKNHLAVVKSSEFSATRATFAELTARQAQVLATLSPVVLLDTLNKHADEADEQSGKHLDSYLGGQVGVEAFVEQYVARRTVFHTLDLKRQVAQQTVTGAGLPM